MRGKEVGGGLEEALGGGHREDDVGSHHLFLNMHTKDEKQFIFELYLCRIFT